MHHMKDMTALQKQMTAMVNIYSFLLRRSNKNSLLIGKLPRLHLKIMILEWVIKNNIINIHFIGY